MPSQFDARQTISHDTLDQIAAAADKQLDDLLRSISSELTMPLRMTPSSTPDLTLSIGAISVQNPETSRNRTIPTISNTLPAFTSGTVVLPASAGGTITVTPGDNQTLTMSNSSFIKVGINLDANGNIALSFGIEGASEAAATVPPAINNTFGIGYIVVETDAGGNVQNIEGSDIFQYMGGGGGGGSGDASTTGDYISDYHESSPYKLANSTVYSRDEDDNIDPLSTGAFSLVTSTFDFSAGSETLITENLLDLDELKADGVQDVGILDLLVIWAESKVDTAATYEISRDGGNEYQEVTMERVGSTGAYRGTHTFDEEAANQNLDDQTSSTGTLELDDSSAQKISQSFSLSADSVVKNVQVSFEKTGSPSGNLCLQVAADDGGEPGDILGSSAFVSVADGDEEVKAESTSVVDDGVRLFGGTSQVRVGVRINLSDPTIITRFSAVLEKEASAAGSFTPYIVNDSGDNTTPDFTSIVATGTSVNLSTVSTGISTVDFELPDTLLSAGIYYLVLEGDGTYTAQHNPSITTGERVFWVGDTSGTGGVYEFGDGSNSWNADADSHAFTAYGKTPFDGLTSFDVGDIPLEGSTTYHWVVQSDAEYKASFSTGVDAVAIDIDSSADGLQVNNGSTWSDSSTDGAVYQIDGRALNLKLRITSSTSDVGIEGHSVHYDIQSGRLATAPKEVHTDEFLSNTDNENTFTLPFLPEPDLLKVYHLGTGQVFRHDPAGNLGFRLDGFDVVFAPDTFTQETDQLVRLVFDQTNGGSFDNSDQNAADIAELQQNVIDIGEELLMSSPFVDMGETTLPTVAGAGYTQVINRAPLKNYWELRPLFGIERIPIQQIARISSESGPNGEETYQVVGDQFARIRCFGPGWENWSNTSGQVIRSREIGDKIEIVFYGTGLNILKTDDANNRDVTWELDGVDQGQSPAWDGGFSEVLNGRNYAPNSKHAVVSGLSQGLHTVIFTDNTGGVITLSGIEVLNETSQVEVAGGSYFYKGKKRTSSATSLPYNSGFENEEGADSGDGGRVIVYQKSDGTIAHSVKWNDAGQANFGAADFSDSEITGEHFFREFGAGRADDFSQLPFSGTNNVAFTLDDGVTGITGSGISALANNGIPDGVLFGNAASRFTILHFVGTGLAFYQHRDTAGITYDVTVDGSSIGTQSFTSVGLHKIVSGLPYGSHVVKIEYSSGSTALSMSKYLVYGTKKPALPADAVELGNYNILADTDYTSVAFDTPSTGTIIKTAERESVLTGNHSSLQLNFATNEVGTFRIRAAANVGNIITHNFFGDSIAVRLDRISNSATVDVRIDGVLIDGTNTLPDGSTPTASTLVNTTDNTGGSYTVGTGAVDTPAIIAITGLGLGHHTFEIEQTGGSGEVGLRAFEIGMPIYTPTINTQPIINNTSRIGSNTIGDSRNFAKDIIVSNRQALANGFIDNPSTNDSTYPGRPVGEMAAVIKTTGKPITVQAWVRFTSSVVNRGINMHVMVDGFEYGNSLPVDAHATGENIFAAKSEKIYLPAGEHYVSINIRTTGGSSTQTLSGTNRGMIVEEED